ncbi:MAG: hypothetical protein ACW98U_06120 [Candidatus Thorarchaeota archaeon]|jgi:hypothetical protein
MSSDDIEWNETPADDEIVWERPQFEQPPPPPFNPVRILVRQVKRIPSRIVIAILLIGLVAISSIAVLEAQQIEQLNNELETIQQEFENLQQDYDDLRSHYSDLFSDYSALEATLEDPLTNPVTPTLSSVLNWLAQDNTDECEFVEGVWNCGDYAAMLMTRAKEMKWRVRIAVISYSLLGNPGYGNTTDAYGSYGHAFNFIECTDGIWYIEPQTDGMWYIVDGVTQDRTEFTPYEYYDFVDSDLDTIWDGYHWWTNYYNRFA